MGTTEIQPRLDLIPHDYRGEIIGQRAKDGYINATAMCKAAGKLFADYHRSKTTQEFLGELSGSMGIPIDLLVSSVSTGPNEHRGTWVHPQVATHLAQWASPRFAVLVSQWVHEWMTGAGKAERAWKIFNDRIDLVSDQVPLGYFCIFRETADLYASFIRGGIDPGTRILLDISVGQHWSKFWKKEGLAAIHGASAKYSHYYPAYYRQSLSNPQTPLCYPEDALPAFRRWMREVYIPLKLPLYLKGQVGLGKIGTTEATAAVAALEHRDRNRSLPSAAGTQTGKEATWRKRNGSPCAALTGATSWSGRTPSRPLARRGTTAIRRSSGWLVAVQRSTSSSTKTRKMLLAQSALFERG